MSRARTKTRYAMILFSLVCSTVHADLITNPAVALSSRATRNSTGPQISRPSRGESVFDSSARNNFRQPAEPVHLLLPIEEAHRKTSATFRSDSARWINPWVRPTPNLPLLPLDDVFPDTSSVFQRTFDELSSVLRRLIVGKQRRITYRGCRNTADPEACAHYK